MLERKFQYDGATYKLELDKYSFAVYEQRSMGAMNGGLLMAALGEEPVSFYRCYSPDKPVVKAALAALAADPYKALRHTHVGAINRMIESLAGRELDWKTLLVARQKLGLVDGQEKTPKSVKTFDGIEARFHSVITSNGENWVVYKGVVQENPYKKGFVFFTFLEGCPEDVTCRESLKAVRSFIGVI